MANVLRVALTGASGTVGQFVLARLAAEGVKVRAASHSAQSPATKQAKGVEWVRYSMKDSASAANLLADCDALVHCALHHEPGRYRGGEAADPAGFWATNLGGTLNLLAAAEQAGTKRAVLLSSRAVFADGSAARRGVCNDSSPTQPNTHYGALKQAEEAVARSWSANKDNKLEICCLRATGVYGVQQLYARSKWFDAITKVANGQAIIDVRAGTEVHGSDVADAIWRLLHAPAAGVRGRAFNCSDQLVSSRMIARALNTLTNQALSLPAITQSNSTPMLCNGLRELGWRPGGKARLKQTLATLLEKTR